MTCVRRHFSDDVEVTSLVGAQGVIVMLTPLDIETTVFRRSMRGYDKAEVQEFMARVAADYEFLYKENMELKEQLQAMDEKIAQYIRLEESMRNALMLAQQTAEEVKAAAQKQCELMVREGEMKVEQIRSRMRDEINAELRRLSELRQKSEQARAQLRAVLTSHLELLDRQLPVTEAGSSEQEAIQTA